MSDELEKVRIYYERSADFRTIYASGTFVNITPQSNIQLSTFNATNRLTALLDNQNEEGYTFKLTGHAFVNAWDLLKKVHLFLGDRFITPSIVSDGEGGVDIEWARNDKEVLMGVRGESHKDDYVYFQQGAIYGGENLSLPYLKDRLAWLFQDEL